MSDDRPQPIREVLRALTPQIQRSRLTLVVAPGGSGKTSLLRDWRALLEGAGEAVAWLETSAGHADPGFFLEDWVFALRQASSEEASAFGGPLLASLAHLDDSDPGALARYVSREWRGFQEPVVIFLDNSHLLGSDTPAARLLDRMLRDSPPQVHWVLASRGARPRCVARLLAAGEAFEVSAEDLSLRADQVAQVLAGAGIESEEVTAQLLAETRGWATGVQLAARALTRVAPAERSEFVRSLAQHGDLFDYVAGEVVGDESQELIELLEWSALLGPCEESNLVELTQEAIGHRLDEAIGKGLLQRTGSTIAVHHLWEDFLTRRVRHRSSAAEWRAMQVRVAEVIAQANPERALRTAEQSEAWGSVALLLAEHGRDWVGRGRFETVDGAFASLPASHRAESVELRHLEGMLAARRDPPGAVLLLESVARDYRKAGQSDEESLALLDAWILATNANLTEPMPRILRRLLSMRKLVTDPKARALSVIALSVLAFSRGRQRLADRILQRLRPESLPAVLATAVATGRVMVGRYVDWDQTIRILDDALDGPSQGYAPAYFLFLSTRALLRGYRGHDLDACLRDAREGAEAVHDFGYSVSEMGCFDAVGKLESLAGRSEAAVEAFLRAAELAAEVGQAEYEASLRGHAAFELLAQGATDSARTQATLAAQRLEAGLARGNYMALQFPAVLGLCALAECGEAAEAYALGQRHAKSFRTGQLTIGEVQTRILLARVAFLAGHTEEAESGLEEARAVMKRESLQDCGTEMPASVLTWFSSGGSAPGWDVQTLGEFQVRRSGTALDPAVWRGNTTRRLLLRLLVAGGRERRDAVLADLWPEANSERARASLRVALSRLRRAIGAEAVASEGSIIALDPSLVEGWDVTRLQKALRSGGSVDDLLDAYPGGFAPELFEDWTDDLRRELEGSFLREVFKRLEDSIDSGAAGEAAEAAARLTAAHPSEERGWRLRIKAERARGEETAAESILAQARSTLEREFGPGAGRALDEVG